MKTNVSAQAKKLLSLFAHAALCSTFFATPVWAATKTVTLSVPGMTCAACPLTVKAALSKVDGVMKANASLEKREVTVTFDDARTDIQALTKATENAGYPSAAKPPMGKL